MGEKLRGGLASADLTSAVARTQIGMVWGRFVRRRVPRTAATPGHRVPERRGARQCWRNGALRTPTRGTSLGAYWVLPADVLCGETCKLGRVIGWVLLQHPAILPGTSIRRGVEATVSPSFSGSGLIAVRRLHPASPTPNPNSPGGVGGDQAINPSINRPLPGLCPKRGRKPIGRRGA